MKTTKDSASSEGGQTKSDRALERFADMLIGRMKAMRASDWQQGWIGADGTLGGHPQNILGRGYGGLNEFMLRILSAEEGYAAPVFLVFKQSSDAGLRINKGAKSFPVFFWKPFWTDSSGAMIKESEYDDLSADDKSALRKHWFLRVYDVFNIDQTNMREVRPDMYEQLTFPFTPREMRDTAGMYANAAIDRMLERQEWVCPIVQTMSLTQPCYKPGLDKILVPAKERFNVSSSPEEVYKDGQEYYGTLIHEMAHSTGAEGRLNRNIRNGFGNKDYAKEELVAEITAAMVGSALGFDHRITDNSAAYVDGWITRLSQNPEYVKTLMVDVNKASKMIFEKIEQQEIAIAEQETLSAPEKSAYVIPEHSDVVAEPLSAPRTMLYASDILRKTDGGLLIFHDLFGDACGEKLFRNPYREDTRPSCKLFSKTDGRTGLSKYVLHDFGDSSWCGDCFDIVGKLHNMNGRANFHEVLGIIDREYFLDAARPHRDAAALRRLASSVPALDNSGTRTHYTAVVHAKPFSTAELSWWDHYGIDPAILERYHVTSAMAVDFSKPGRKSFQLYSSARQPLYVYQVGHSGGVKCYRPMSKTRFMYGGELPHPYIFGTEQLPRKGEILFITGGEKDVMSLAARGYNAVAFNSETMSIPEDTMLDFSARFRHVLFLYDSDATGQKESARQSEHFARLGNVGRVVLPLAGTKQEKDISDFFALGHSTHELNTLAQNECASLDKALAASLEKASAAIVDSAAQREPEKEKDEEHEQRPVRHMHL